MIESAGLCRAGSGGAPRGALLSQRSTGVSTRYTYRLLSRAIILASALYFMFLVLQLHAHPSLRGARHASDLSSAQRIAASRHLLLLQRAHTEAGGLGVWGSSEGLNAVEAAGLLQAGGAGT